MLYLKYGNRLRKTRNNTIRLEKLNRVARPGEVEQVKTIKKAKKTKDKKYKKVILTEKGLQELDSKAEIQFDDKGFEDNDSGESKDSD